MKLLFFGDSITFGYDPRLGSPGRFDDRTRWSARLAAALEAEAVNFSACGLCVPSGAAVRRYTAELAAHPDADVCLVLFGTNDLLRGASPETVADRLAAFLRALAAAAGQTRLLCIAPPLLAAGSWTDAASVRASRALGTCISQAAEATGCAFFDAGARPVDLLFDGVHPSAEGHAALAAYLAPAVRTLSERMNHDRASF